MNTSILAFALIGASLASSWQNDYHQAQKQAAEQKKPLVVVFGTGANGWTKVIRAEGPSPEVAKLLSEHYICVYVDTTDATGKKLAQNFDIAGDVGLVISNHGGGLQAFWHQGDMTNQSISGYLTKFADPQLVVHQTETVNSARNSYYPFGAFSQGATRTFPSANC